METAHAKWWLRVLREAMILENLTKSVNYMACATWLDNARRVETLGISFPIGIGRLLLLET